MRSLIVGMGFGSAVYAPVLKSLKHEVITLDPVRPANFTSIEDLLEVYEHFDTVNITTPNYTHEPIARQLADYSDIIFVEKPGVINSSNWSKLIEDFPDTRFMMVKNNQYRVSISQFRTLSRSAEKVTICWENNNRIPNPGSWFTTKELAFGGVSRDLMPHLLSYYTILTDYQVGTVTHSLSKQRYNLSDLTNTDYGTIDKEGIFDVDDMCEIRFNNKNTEYHLTADWKSNNGLDLVYIDFDGVRYDLGLCPEIAYKEMINQTIKNKNNDEFWQNQYEQDMWIHRQIENL